jgi:hypothetical protein
MLFAVIGQLSLKGFVILTNIGENYYCGNSLTPPWVRATDNGTI